MINGGQNLRQLISTEAFRGAAELGGPSAELDLVSPNRVQYPNYPTFQHRCRGCYMVCTVPCSVGAVTEAS